jgi:hypothetical protein
MKLSELKLSDDTKAIIASNLTLSHLSLILSGRDEDVTYKEIAKTFNRYLKSLFEELEDFQFYLDRR